MESWVNFSGKEGHPNIQPSTRPGIKPGTSGLGGRDLTTAPTPPLYNTRKETYSVSYLLLGLHPRNWLNWTRDTKNNVIVFDTGFQSTLPFQKPNSGFSLTPFDHFYKHLFSLQQLRLQLGFFGAFELYPFSYKGEMYLAVMNYWDGNTYSVNSEIYKWV